MIAHALTWCAAALAASVAAAPAASPDELEPPTPDDVVSTASELEPLQQPSLTLEPHIATWLELDTNARRLPSGQLQDGVNAAPEPTLSNDGADGPGADGLIRSSAFVHAALRWPRVVLRTDTAAGLKAFFTAASERMVVVQSRSALVASLLPGDAVLTMNIWAKARVQRSGARSYGLLRSDMLVDKPVLPWLVVRAGVHGQAFESFDAPLFSSAGAGALGAVRLLNEREQLDLVIDGSARAFPLAPKRLDQPSEIDRRFDTVTTLSMQAISARRLFLSAGWLVVRNASNARGESWWRHRLSAAVGLKLPEQITCAAQGAVQITAYDDGVSIGQLYFLGDDEENQNVFELLLARPMVAGLFLEARMSWMGNELAVEGARFSRQTASIGVRAEL